jgi:hypothetical protein
LIARRVYDNDPSSALLTEIFNSGDVAHQAVCVASLTYIATVLATTMVGLSDIPHDVVLATVYERLRDQGSPF